MLQLQSYNNGRFIFPRHFHRRGRFQHSFSNCTTPTAAATTTATTTTTTTITTTTTSAATTTTKAAAKNTPKIEIVDYLVNSLGFSTEEAIATSLKVPGVSTTCQNPDLVIELFKQAGCDDKQIKAIVTKYPGVLKSDVEKTLKPKIAVLQELGVSGFDLMEIASRTRYAGADKLKTHIDFLLPIMGSVDNVVRVVKRVHWVFTVENATLNVAILRKYGVSDERLRKALTRLPGLLQCNTEKLEENCARVKYEFKIPIENAGFLTMVMLLKCFSDETFEAKYDVFRSFGWSETNIVNMIRIQPDCLKSSATTIRTKLDFLMGIAGCKADFLAKQPVIMNYSLEKRLIPRYAVFKVLKDQSLIKANFSYYYFLDISDDTFVSRFVIPYEDDLPGLYQAYTNKEMDSFVQGLKS